MADLDKCFCINVFYVLFWLSHPSRLHWQEGRWVGSCRLLVNVIDYGESNCRFEFKTVDSKVCVEVTVPRRRISTGRRISLVSHAVDHRSVGFTDIMFCLQ